MHIIMRYCKKCVQPDTRPKISFDAEGICMACRYTEDAATVIDWNARQKELREIAEWAKHNTHAGYNCVVGVSGGKDSTFQALYARDNLGLHPLLVNAVPENITEAGKRNIDNLSRLGFDLFMIRPNPNIMQRLIKRDFYRYLNPQKVTEYTLWASAYQVALAYGIPLVVQGENAALTLGVTDGMDTDGDAANVYKSNTLSGGDAVSEYGCDVEHKYLLQYQFPNRKTLDHAGIKAIWLQYYLKEWSRRHNAEFAIAHGLSLREDKDPAETGRCTTFGAIDSDLNIVGQMLKYYKFGFGCVTDEVSYDIREGRLTRNEGIELVKKYDGKCGDKYIKEFCSYLEISVEEFWRVVDGFVNKALFHKNSLTGKWEPLFEVGKDFYVED